MERPETAQVRQVSTTVILAAITMAYLWFSPLFPTEQSAIAEDASIVSDTVTIDRFASALIEKSPTTAR